MCVIKTRTPPGPELWSVPVPIVCAMIVLREVCIAHRQQYHSAHMDIRTCEKLIRGTEGLADHKGVQIIISVEHRL